MRLPLATVKSFDDKLGIVPFKAENLFGLPPDPAGPCGNSGADSVSKTSSTVRFNHSLIPVPSMSVQVVVAFERIVSQGAWAQRLQHDVSVDDVSDNFSELFQRRIRSKFDLAIGEAGGVWRNLRLDRNAGLEALANEFFGINPAFSAKREGCHSAVAPL